MSFGNPTEIRHTDKQTGGQKAVRIARFDLIPAIPHWDLAEVFGRGSLKYADNNWRKGYDWGISIAALERHLALFKAGEDFDNCKEGCPPDCVNHTGAPHIMQVAWHCYVLREFMILCPEKDNRFKLTLDQLNALKAKLANPTEKPNTEPTQEP